jgi:hypothetical protein
MATIGQLAVAARDGIEEKKAENDKYLCFVPEWKENAKGQKVIEKFNLNTDEYLNLLKWLGFRRYDTGGKWILIRIIDNVAEEIEMHQLADTLMKHLNEMPTNHTYYHAHQKLKNYVYNSTDFLFNKNSKLQYLYSEVPIVFNTDTETEAFFYFQNGFVIATKSGLNFKPYSQMASFTADIKGMPTLIKKIIWKSQLLDRDFKKVPAELYKKFDWYLFLQNITQKDVPERLQTLQQLLGYIMHSYMQTKLKAVILTDSSISEKAEGRSGKTLLGKSIQHILNPANATEINKVASELNGKNFKTDDTFRYQTLGLGTKVVILNDVKPRFKFDQLFNDITEGLDRTRKTESPVKLYCKFLIPTNETIELPSGSYKDRAVEFELSNHYNDRWEPMNDFKKRFFGNEWTQEDWACFDNIMLDCVSIYLLKGMPNIIKTINLDKRKVITETSSEFVEFMNLRFFGEEETERLLLIPTTEFDEKGEYRKKHFGENADELFANYLIFNTDAAKLLTKKTFDKWIKKYVTYSDKISKVEEHRSNSVKKYYFFTN